MKAEQDDRVRGSARPQRHVRVPSTFDRYRDDMPPQPTIVAKLRSADPKITWGLYLLDEDRWLDLLFNQELEARRFAKNLMQASAAA
jgi:hypothetical protein